MMKSRLFPIVLASVIALAVGCQEQQPPAATTELSFQHGAQLLAAGSPKSAITFLSQNVASNTANPDASALLCMAYALDLQPQAALDCGKQIKRPDKCPPGWEVVGMGIAEMSRQNQPQAIADFQQILAQPENAITPAARQWLVLTYLVNGDDPKAMAAIKKMAMTPYMKPTAMLWSVLMHAKQGRTQLAAEALTQAAAGLTKDPGPVALEGTPDDQTLYDAALSAVAAGNFARAQELFDRLRQQNPDAADSSTWVALLAAARGDWQATRSLLQQACETGSSPARGLASQTYSVVCAMENRPEDVIRNMVSGQRLLARTNRSKPVVPAQPDRVWGSDKFTQDAPQTPPSAPAPAVARPQPTATGNQTTAQAAPEATAPQMTAFAPEEAPQILLAGSTATATMAPLCEPTRQRAASSPPAASVSAPNAPSPVASVPASAKPTPVAPSSAAPAAASGDKELAQSFSRFPGASALYSCPPGYRRGPVDPTSGVVGLRR